MCSNCVWQQTLFDTPFMLIFVALTLLTFASLHFFFFFLVTVLLIDMLMFSFAFLHLFCFIQVTVPQSHFFVVAVSDINPFFGKKFSVQHSVVLIILSVVMYAFACVILTYLDCHPSPNFVGQNDSDHYFQCLLYHSAEFLCLLFHFAEYLFSERKRYSKTYV